MPLEAKEQEFKFRRFIKLRAQGVTPRQIMDEIEISKNTFTDWKRIDENEEQFLTFLKLPPPNRKTTPADDRLLHRVALQNQWSNLSELRQLPAIAANDRLTEVIVGQLYTMGVKHRIAAEKELLTAVHTDRRLLYATNMKDWTVIDWARGIFIDEFCYSTADRGRTWVWREVGTRYDPQNIRQHVVLMFHSFFYGIGPIRRVERLNQDSYADYLENALKPYIESHPAFEEGDVLLLHDNHPAHTSRQVIDWINTNFRNSRDFVFPHPSRGDHPMFGHLSGVLKLVRDSDVKHIG
ncbi:unnamed protein product [Medioppia subpectinata]|uniref:Transposase n=1 Tax=Medioppia subpectinata TaxID=1979941 RepID=A0A7R9Q4F3_9ACAR|nr:unnamed protein product [Medioppia subpectinata]CAG2112224.1 unnamed protein product [Medioppia subpectinata]